MGFSNHRILLLLSFTLAFKIIAEENKQKEDDIQYLETHAFSREENIKNFQENYNKIKNYLFQKIINDENKSQKEINENFATLKTITANILEHSSYYKDISGRDMLFNNYFLEQVLFEDDKGEALLDTLTENNETISEKLVTCINLITRNNWYRKANNIMNLIKYKEEDRRKDFQKINDLYKKFKEDEYEFINIFSQESAEDRYGIDDYNFLIDFTNSKLAIKTQFFTKRNLIVAILTIVIAFFIYKLIRCDVREAPDKDHHMLYRCTYPYKYLKLDKILSFICKLLKETIISKIKGIITSKNEWATLGAFVISIVNIFFNTLTAILPIAIYLILTAKLFFWPKNFNRMLFNKFYVISRYIKNAHILYDICRRNKHLQIFLYNDLANLRRFFETENKDLKDLIHTALNSSQNLCSINIFNLMRISDFICRFDKSREKFHDSILDFLTFKNYINTLQIRNNNMSQEWSVPTFINEGMSLNFKNLYNISLKNGGMPIDLCVNRDNKGLFFCETDEYNEKKLQQALMLCLVVINGYGLCPCENAEICILDYIHYTPNIFTGKNINNDNLLKWIDTATIYFDRVSKIKRFYKRKLKTFEPKFFNIMNEIYGNEMMSKMTVNLILHILKDDNSFLYLINHNDDIYKLKSKYPKLGCSNKYIEYIDSEDKNEIINNMNGNDKLNVKYVLKNMMTDRSLYVRSTYLTKPPTI